MANIYTELRKAGIRLNSKGHIHKDDISLAEPILQKYTVESMGPQYVGKTDFGLKDPGKNLKMYRNLEKKNGILLKDFGEYQLLKYPTYIAMIQPESKHISYLVNFERKIVFGKKAITQILLWRERPNQFLANLTIDNMKLTAYVFFKILFAESECIVTDAMQTMMGKEFWDDRISDAWAYGYPIYYINQNSKERIKLTPENFEEVSLENKIWSEEDGSLAKKIAICKKEF
jgi:hypothetical protein